MTDTDPIIILDDEDFVALDLAIKQECPDTILVHERMHLMRTLRRMLPEILARKQVARARWKPPVASYAMFEDEDGDPVYVNPAHVVALRPSDDGCCICLISAERGLMVKHTPGEVLARLTATGDPQRDAAGDLLDALRRVMRHIPNDAGGASLGDDMSRARRAIAKAEGQS
ncbi:MAG: hypothetical protein RLZZ127_1991 [Planctomycetota bacterium]|jgi:hypothetical protein